MTALDSSQVVRSELPHSRFKGITRWKASLVHLGISAVVALVALLLLYFVWYPHPFFEASGGKRLLMLLAGVDVVLGPLITLIIFNPKKKSLSFDLAVVGIIQFAALCYGMYVMALARPAYIVFAVDRFEVVSANELEPENLTKVTRGAYKRLPWTGPRLVFARMPSDLKEKEQILFSAVQRGVDLQHYPQHYAPYAEHALQALAKARPLGELAKARQENQDPVAAFVTASGKREEDFRFLPARAKRDMAAVLDAQSGEVRAFLLLYPW